MGGIGKSVLARALCDDPVVRQAFPDAILWFTIGRERTADPRAQLEEAARALHDDPSHYATLPSARNRFRSILRNQAVLIVLDDVWDIAAIQPFCVDSPRSRLLLTTRTSAIAAGLGATEHLADLLAETDARQILARWSDVAVEQQPPKPPR